MDQFIQRFEDWRKGREINPPLLFAYWDNLESSRLSNSSKNRHLQQLRPWVNEQRLRMALPFVKADIYDALKPWPEIAREPEVLNAAQVKALMAAAPGVDPRMAMFAMLGLTTGARCSEIGSITPEAWRADHLVIADTKRGRDKRVPLKWSSTLTGLSGCAEFPRYTAKKVPPTPHWRKLLVAAGLPITFEPRILRRTAASFAASSGKVPAVWLAEWFGHTNAVADRFYRLAQSEANGDTIEEWYGCAKEFVSLREKLFGVPVPAL